jgi:hypothetical protein
MIYWVEDKNNDQLDCRLMGQFRWLLNDATLKEIHLQGRLFTWSNGRFHHTLELIDHVFISTEWETLYLSHNMHSLALVCWDHAPLLLRIDNVFRGKKRFQFRCFWPKFLGFFDVVHRAWPCPQQEADMFQRLDWMLRNTTRTLRSWSDRFIENICMQLELAKEIVHRLDAARDQRTLVVHEESLHQEMKLKSLGLSSLQRTIEQQ